MRIPKYWYRKTGFMARVMTPASMLWQWQTRRRLRQPSTKLDIPVICVGNINMGGTGKTPTVIHLAQALTNAGYNPFVLTRGYGGANAGPLRARPEHAAAEIGDEAVLIANFVPVIIAHDRAKGGQMAVSEGADILIMDDGFQNPKLHKDVSIIVMDADAGMGNGRVFPSGPLRETLADAGPRADVFLLIGEGKKTQQIRATIGDDHPIVEAKLAPVETGMPWYGRRVLAFAGIGRPEKFFNTLQGLGVKLVATRSFGDHQNIPPLLLQRMDREAKAQHAQLVTTEKDAARMPSEWQGRVLSLPVRLQITSGDLLAEITKRLL